MALPRPELGRSCARQTALPATDVVSPSRGRCAPDETVAVRGLQAALAGFGVVALHLAQALQHVTALLRKVPRYGYDLPASMGQAVYSSRQYNPRQTVAPKPWPLNEIEEVAVLQEHFKLPLAVAAELLVLEIDGVPGSFLPIEHIDR